MVYEHLIQSWPKSYLYQLIHHQKQVFIDRDPTHFRHIVNYLRGVDTVSHLRDPVVLRDVLLEARFYELPGLVEQIERLLS